MNAPSLAAKLEQVRSAHTIGVAGRVSQIVGMTVGVADFPVPTGSMCRIQASDGRYVDSQAIGFRAGQTLLMPFGELHGIAVGDPVVFVSASQRVGVSPAMLGRVLNGLGEPMDDGPPIRPETFCPLYRRAPGAMQRLPIDQPLATGVRSIDAFASVGKGQRLGLFAGTGVGKSVLLGMIARYTSADVAVVALVGERSREVGRFISHDLGQEGLRKSVVVVSPSDESPLIRLRGGFLATAIAEYFRDQGKDVVVLMDSLTRLAMAQRQIGLAAGEPPAQRGYTPSVYAALPPLVERAGRTAAGSITGIYTVLVEGDDINDPVGDMVRGILDGHIWLSRALANRAHYPAVAVLESISRVMVDVVEDAHLQVVNNMRRLMAIYQDIEDLVNLGAYVPGTNIDFDLAIQAKSAIDAFLQQPIEQGCSWQQMREELSGLQDTIDKTARTLSRRPQQPPPAQPRGGR
jgi:flagellum-specific ATP synthase